MIKTYWPLALVLLYLIGSTLLHPRVPQTTDMMTLMINFMGFFFCAFAFFKLLDVPKFAHAFRSYDPLTKLVPAYGYIYPFIELGLGVSYLLRWNLDASNAITIIVLGVGTIGVVRAVIGQQQIQCACLGTVFDLPMSQITIIENTTMILMALWILLI